MPNVGLLTSRIDVLQNVYSYNEKAEQRCLCPFCQMKYVDDRQKFNLMSAAMTAALPIGLVHRLGQYKA